MTSEAEPHRPVETSAEVMADLWSKVDEMDTRDFTAYALGLGLTPPAEPAGYKGWEVVIAYPNNDFDNGVLYWWGPEEDHGEEDFPAEAPTADGQPAG